MIPGSRRIGASQGLALLLVPALAGAAPVTGSFDERLRALEQRAQASRGQVELVAELQMLRAEIRDIRGLVEEQRNAMETLERRQRGLYLDLDDRLARLERGIKVSGDPVIGSEQPDVSAQAPADTEPRATLAGGSTSVAERTAYERGFELVKRGRYQEAITALGQFLEAYPDGIFAANAQYWIAECHYVAGDTGQAMAQFRNVLERYPESAKRPDAMVKIGYLQDAAGQWSEARASLEQVVSEWPGSSAAQLAGQRLDKMRQEGH